MRISQNTREPGLFCDAHNQNCRSGQDALAALYDPLMVRLSTLSGTLKKLSFSVRRIANVEEWGTFAEEKILDRRKAGAFYGRGSLIAAATQELKSTWETGSAAEIQVAMTAFMAKYLRDLLSHAPYAPTQQAEFRAWLKQFAQWLFGTDHITVRYEISYDGVDIRKLSPGTRGIVLLLLYLALDDSDDRPLIIDQPEENLDPKSVFDELVALFIAAKARRQVIIITHNANLVINTDADQIIVAEAGPHTLFVCTVDGRKLKNWLPASGQKLSKIINLYAVLVEKWPIIAQVMTSPGRFATILRSVTKFKLMYLRFSPHRRSPDLLQPPS